MTSVDQAGRLAFRVTFDRIGRRHHPDPLTLTVDDGPIDAVAEQLVAAIYEYARPMCASREIDAELKRPETDGARPLVSADLDGAHGFITAGMQVAGRFTAAIVRETEEAQR